MESNQDNRFSYTATAHYEEGDTKVFHRSGQQFKAKITD